MKFSIDCGHNAYPDTGASGVIQEDDGTKVVGHLVIDGLRASGHTAICSTPFGYTFQSVVGSLGWRCKVSNDNDVDVNVSIHMNASNGQGHGCEVYAISDAGRELAQRVQNNLASLGFADRGVKSENLYVLRNTKAVSILVEMCFCDSQTDMDIYNPNKIAEAIVSGLIGHSINIPAPAPIQPSTGTSMSVISLQHALNRLDMTDDNGRKLVEDGISGPRTDQAIHKLQSITGLDDVQQAIDIIVSKPMLGIKYTNRVATRYLQWRLQIGLDGIFWSGTRDALKTYQREHGIDDDGVCGPNTWSILIG